jgi:hypothetical protein
MLTVAAVFSLIVFIATLLDWCHETTLRRAVPMMVSLALFAAFFGARVALYGE